MVSAWRVALVGALVGAARAQTNVTSTYNYLGTYNYNNKHSLQNFGYSDYDSCKTATANLATCTPGETRTDCFCDQRNLMDEVNTRRCLHSKLTTPITTEYDFRAVNWSTALSERARTIVVSGGSPATSAVTLLSPTYTEYYTIVQASKYMSAKTLIDAFYDAGGDTQNRMVYNGVHYVGCYMGVAEGAFACMYGYNATTSGVTPCEPNDAAGNLDQAACDDCNTYTPSCPVNGLNVYTRATCLVNAQGVYSQIEATTSSTYEEPDELTDTAIALIVIFSVLVAIAIGMVIYFWKQILHWLAPFRPTMHWMKNETKASNIALARHETHVRVKRDTIKGMSTKKRQSVRHIQTMPVFNAHVDVAPAHPHGTVQESTKSAHEHEVPPTYLASSAKAKAASMRARSVKFKGKETKVDMGESYL